MLHTLKPVTNARKSTKRLGRGPGSGTGKTSGKGHKGQLARSGKTLRPGFEGGQIPFFQRIPKRGFHNFAQKRYALLNLKTLETFPQDTVVTPQLLLEKKIIKDQLCGIKVLAQGTLTKKLVVKASKFSKQAQAAILAVGGNIEVI
ncbi:50S ribosomal protein L15 [Hydrangea phyllody phytoplasma]|uniref:Large ribosomal subunit protein uL15 n=6 Tax=16SrI (Aster yellows group) TaxID=3042590 RepID=A0A4P6M967_9MOLU|nr:MULTISPECIES: 50S ribosomal protein L15 [Phytoplasma]GLH61367.1 50S ribosomal protein L15 [Rhus yellows phytoplasma]AOF54871.1 50S ribosomal protein L15 [Maize bushy stunt phytoplasma]MBS2993781.1 50S ribosomal protein L15 ['Santalum album' aster yellows phytoplasma]QBF23932.1 50S ribosomal protein L15 ['Catharanthus roseus' aster yellows phytoplasma]GFZ75366.1 50S ribosomal protein L15 [Hydrangea phyllody phytoplasma]